MYQVPTNVSANYTCCLVSRESDGFELDIMSSHGIRAGFIPPHILEISQSTSRNDRPAKRMHEERPKKEAIPDILQKHVMEDVNDI